MLRQRGTPFTKDIDYNRRHLDFSCAARCFRCADYGCAARAIVVIIVLALLCYRAVDCDGAGLEIHVSSREREKFSNSHSCKHQYGERGSHPQVTLRCHEYYCVVCNGDYFCVKSGVKIVENGC